MVNGKEMYEKAVELITTPMAIDMKANGIAISKMVLEHTTTRMVIFTKESGWTVNSMAKEIIFTNKKKQSIKDIGEMEENKAQAN